MYYVVTIGAFWTFADWTEAWHFACELPNADSTYVYGPEA